MKRIGLIFFFIFLGFFQIQHAQNALIKRTTDLQGYNSLICYWFNSYRIAYSEDSSGTSTNFVGERSTTAPPTKLALPAEMNVADMDHYSEHLVFCGTTGQREPKGFLGILNIPNAFSWGQNMCYFNFPAGNIIQGSPAVNNFKPSKLTFYTDSTQSNGYEYHVALVGECDFYPHEPVIPHPYTTICEAVYDATGWKYWFHCNPFNEYVYTDITATKNYVVAVGRNTNTNRMIIKTFRRHCFQSVGNPTQMGYITEISEAGIGNMVLVEAMEDDTFATVCYYADGSTAGSSIKIFNIQAGGLLPVTSSHFIQNNVASISSSWRLKALKYDAVANKLYLLQDMDYPISSTTVSTIQEYDITNYNAGSVIITYDASYTFYDITPQYLGGPQAIGTHSSYLTTFSRFFSGNRDILIPPVYCLPSYEHSYSIVPTGGQSMIMNEDVLSIKSPHSILYDFHPYIITIDTICNQ